MLYRICLILMSFFLSTHIAIASPLEERLQQYPNWQNKPSLKVAQGDLYYPQWMAGTWLVESILTEQIAPLAPEIMTPGFKDNQQFIEKSFKFLVRFVSEKFVPQTKQLIPQLTNKNKTHYIIADRRFNGEQIASAYLGKDRVLQVKVDPQNPNKQITFLQGDRKLISTVTARAKETPALNRFIATEVSKQLFRSPERIYLNEVETTSDYSLVTPKKIQAQQITAIYLSPQDPNYFKAKNQPVAIYHYQLNLQKITNTKKDRFKD